MSSNVRIMYLRATRSDQPVGCLAYSVDPSTGVISYQGSVVNPKPYELPGGRQFEVNGRQCTTRTRMVRDKFDRHSATKLATEKLAADPIVCGLRFEGEVPRRPTRSLWEVVVSIMIHLSTNKNLPDRASKVACGWLRANGFTKVNRVWVRKDK